MSSVTETQVALTTTPTFSSIPVLDLHLADSPTTKPEFVAQLREALIVVGFFYIKNPPIPPSVRDAFVQKSQDLCNLPLEKKRRIDMINSKHFLGYSQMGLEKTAMKMDHREMFDFLTPMPPPAPEDPVWMNVQGPNQWPDENAVPGFRRALEDYLSSISDLGHRMTCLVAEALDLDANALDRFFHNPPRNKVSLLKYPPPPSPTPKTINGLHQAPDKFQGVGSHKDGGFLTYLLQATAHTGLEAQNKLGQWIPVPPIENTLVVNVGRSLESMTGGVCTATTHRVSLGHDDFLDAQGRPLGPRFSYPVFQTLKLDLTHEELCSLQLPDHILALRRDEKVKSDAEAFFAQYHLMSPGQGIFTARLTSHPDVAQRWYPELLEEALRGQRDFRN